mgnify:CR=1 FL=1
MIRYYANTEQVANSEIFARGGESAKVEGIVSDIIANVKKNGDRALFQYCEQFDQAKFGLPGGDRERNGGCP